MTNANTRAQQIADQLTGDDRALFDQFISAGESPQKALSSLAQQKQLAREQNARHIQAANDKNAKILAATAEADLWREQQDRFIDAYHAGIDDPSTLPHIVDALAAIAVYFYDDDEALRSYNPETGSYDQNNLQREQRGVMGALCQQMWFALEGTNKKGARHRTEWLTRAAINASRYNAGDEIGQAQQEKADTDLARHKMLTLPVMEDFYALTKLAYSATFAEDWAPWSDRVNNVDQRTPEDRIVHFVPKRQRRL